MRECLGLSQIRMRLTVACWLLLLSGPVWSQHYQQDWVNRYWDAWWIGSPDGSGQEYGVYHFRKHFSLDKVPDSFLVRVSADNRYRLFINGRCVGGGPAQGSPQNWFYDTWDLAAYLRPGENIIACQVWNYGRERFPWVQQSLKTAFILEGLSDSARKLNTDGSWRVLEDKAYSSLPFDPAKIREFIIVTPGDSIDGARYPWGWEQPDFDDGSWVAARVQVRGAPAGTGTDLWWQLVPRGVPYLKEDLIRFRTVRRDSGLVSGVPARFLEGGEPLVVPAHTVAKLLLDQGVEMTAWPELLVSGGRDAKITLSYAEALMNKQHLKGNRNDITGKELYGVCDKFVADGGRRRLFRPLWFRAYRYVELEVETGGEALSVEDLHGQYAHVEHAKEAAFATSDTVYNRILETAWHTEEICTKDYLLTDAYYEQLQYVGDNRIQALILNSMGYDRDLVRNTILQYFQSRTSQGLTQSRYPCAIPQIIPTYSLLWIGMVHDYWRYYQEDGFLRSLLPGVASVLDWYECRIDPATGMLGKTEYFNFVDWTREWGWDNTTAIGGVPPGCREGGSSITSMELVCALRDAADLFGHFGQRPVAVRYRQLAERISASVWSRCWDAKKQLLSDTPDKLWFSQHANIYGVLSHTIPAERCPPVLRRILKDTSLVQASLYFRYYLGQAYKAAGMAGEYLNLLQPWKTMLADGLTTFAEVPGDEARSDCHPWSSSPLYEFYATVCGIGPLKPGFAAVAVQPEPGPLQWIRATMLYQGKPLRLDLQRWNGKLGIEGSISLPGRLDGVFYWRDRRVPLHPGLNKIRLAG